VAHPSSAELARTAVARARVAALTTYPRHARPVTTQVRVRDDHGALVVSLSPRSWAAAHLGVRPVGTVRVAPLGCQSVDLQGALRRMPDHDGLACFRFELKSIRIGRRADAVDVSEYRRAAPDPLSWDAPGIVTHLQHGHGADLAACLRAHGEHRAGWAEPLSVDRYGLELAVLHDGGVGTTRLNFPAPVNSVAELAPELSVLMLGADHCGDCHRQT
jgi:hypothetical protein